MEKDIGQQTNPKSEFDFGLQSGLSNPIQQYPVRKYVGEIDPRLLKSKKSAKLSVFLVLSGSARAKAASRTWMKLTPGADPIELFFRFFSLANKLGHFTNNLFMPYVTNMQAYQQKTEKFFVSEENKFYRIGSRSTRRYLELCFWWYRDE